MTGGYKRKLKKLMKANAIPDQTEVEVAGEGEKPTESPPKTTSRAPDYYRHGQNVRHITQKKRDLSIRLPYPCRVATQSVNIHHLMVCLRCSRRFLLSMMADHYTFAHGDMDTFIHRCEACGNCFDCEGDLNRHKQDA